MKGRPGDAHAAVHGRSFQAESTNWSGYAVTGANGAFNQRVRQLDRADRHLPAATSRRGSAQYAAFWVGLDGYSSNSVEQTGTDSDCDGTTPDYYGWYEMYPANPVYFTNTVKPGDAISASVTFSGTADLHAGAEGQHPGLDPDDHQEPVRPGPVLRRGHHRGAVVEQRRPAAGRLRHCHLRLSTANGTSLGSQSPTEIIMVDNSGADKDSTSSINGSGGFSNTWLRAS